MKRILLLVICTLGIFTLVNAQKGIRVESHGSAVIVYVNNEQMCTPVNSCFIANLGRGVYNIEVYAGNEHHNKRRHKPIFSKKVHYKGIGIEEININTGEKPHRPNTIKNRLMSEQAFTEFYSSMKSSNFDDSRSDLLKAVLVTTDFTSEQARSLSKLYNFDNTKIKFMKLIYPNIIDKAEFFIVINTLDFDNNKKEIAKFIEEYHK